MSKINDQLVQSIFKKLGKDECEQFVKPGEMPATKLSKEEMELVKGGISLEDLARIYKIYKEIQRLIP